MLWVCLLIHANRPTQFFTGFAGWTFNALAVGTELTRFACVCAASAVAWVRLCVDAPPSAERLRGSATTLARPVETALPLFAGATARTAMESAGFQIDAVVGAVRQSCVADELTLSLSASLVFCTGALAGTTVLVALVQVHAELSTTGRVLDAILRLALSLQADFFLCTAVSTEVAVGRVGLQVHAFSTAECQIWRAFANTLTLYATFLVLA